MLHVNRAARIAKEYPVNFKYLVDRPHGRTFQVGLLEEHDEIDIRWNEFEFHFLSTHIFGFLKPKPHPVKGVSVYFCFLLQWDLDLEVNRG